MSHDSPVLPAPPAGDRIVGDQITVYCPADGRQVGAVDVLTPGDVAGKCTDLRAAQPEWEELGPKRRSRYLLDWLDWMLDNEQRLTTLIQAESGKSWGDASLEMAVPVEVINYYAKNAESFLADRKVKPGGPIHGTRRLRVQYRPYQLVGLITPWNAPLGNPVMDSVGALAAGAAVMTKPSEVTPLAWTEAVRGWREDVGAPAVLDVATGGPGAGAAVIDNVDMLMFTGSVRTGRAIATRCAERLIPCSLELGGKDALIVLEDADIERAATAAVWGAMTNSGQICISVERAYVVDSVYDDFVARVVRKVSALRQGMDGPGEFRCEIGAMATSTQVDLVSEHVEDAVAKGARVLTGGHRGPRGNFFEPTVLVDVDHSMACMRDETFGPTLPIMRVRDEDEAIALANSSDFGLSSSVWTDDLDRARRLSRRIEAGSVVVNNVLLVGSQLPLPMGGWKTSGLGSRFGGAQGVLKYCRQQAVVEDRFSLQTEPLWYPVSPKKSRAIAAVLRLVGAHDWRRRLGVKGKPARDR